MDKTKDVAAEDELTHERTKALTSMAETYFNYDVDEAAYWWNHELDRAARPSLGIAGTWTTDNCSSYKAPLAALRLRAGLKGER
jgi:hypothetical protein